MALRVKNKSLRKRGGLCMWGAPPDVKRRARNAALINLFTCVGGFFYAGNWVYGLIYSIIMLFAFFSVFFGIGLFLVPMLWIFSVPIAYMLVLRSSMMQRLWAATDEPQTERYRDELGGEDTRA